MRSIFTPLRYPGGKTKLYPYVRDIIQLNHLLGCTYIEPFAGGAGLALKLLLNNIVSRIVLNDIDYAIYSFWISVLEETKQFCDLIEKVPLNVVEWQKQKNIYMNQEEYSRFEVGFSTFYLNRTNVSGVLRGGIIGGLSQEGSYKIDARFNRSDLVSRIKAIAEKKEFIDIYNWNAEEFIVNIIPTYENSFINYDPPYVKKGPSLYTNSFTKNDHINLSKMIVACQENWIITYDKCDFIQNLYSDFRQEIILLNYSTGKTKKGNEVVIFSNNIESPQPTISENELE